MSCFAAYPHINELSISGRVDQCLDVTYANPHTKKVHLKFKDTQST